MFFVNFVLSNAVLTLGLVELVLLDVGDAAAPRAALCAVYGFYASRGGRAAAGPEDSRLIVNCQLRIAITAKTKS